MRRGPFEVRAPKMRKSLLQSSTSGTSSGVSGRCTDFIAIIDYANIPDTTGFTFEEHVNRESARVFELRNPVFELFDDFNAFFPSD